MPIYSYKSSDKKTSCEHCQGGFDVMQKMAEDKLLHCPECGSTLKRIITAANLSIGITSDSGNTLSDKNIKKNGFTQYRKVSKGLYERSAGDGPEFISGD